LYQVITFYAGGCDGNTIDIQASLLSGCSNAYTGKYKKSTCLLSSGELQTSLCSDNQCTQNCTSPTSEVCTTASNSTVTCSSSLPTPIPGGVLLTGFTTSSCSQSSLILWESYAADACPLQYTCNSNKTTVYEYQGCNSYPPDCTTCYVYATHPIGCKYAQNFQCTPDSAATTRYIYGVKKSKYVCVCVCVCMCEILLHFFFSKKN